MSHEHDKGKKDEPKDHGKERPKEAPKEPVKEHKEQPKPEDNLLKRGFGHAASQVFLKLRKPAAQWAAKHIPEPLKDRAQTWAKALPYISTVIATITPDAGIWSQIDDFQQDFFDALESELSRKANGDGGESSVDDSVHRSQPSHKPLVDPAANQYIRICTLISGSEFSQEVRDSFFLGFKKLSEEQVQAMFHIFAAADDKKLAEYLRMNPRDLERLIDGMPKEKKPESILTYLQLRLAAKQNEAANKTVTEFLQRAAAGQQGFEQRFWEAVERMHYKTLAEFLLLFNLSDPEILSRLHLTPLLPKSAARTRSFFDKISRDIAGINPRQGGGE